jgi:hypothetical protein
MIDLVTLLILASPLIVFVTWAVWFWYDEVM